ncbi:MAG TPA: universal stress protein [Pyrinomonadaceae bacterium]|nr:universal stress protein [Pyrinomonadaceae bacterium]
MSLQIMRNEQSLDHSSRALPTSALKTGKLKVFIPYDGSESSDTALDSLKRAGLPQRIEALVAVTQVWLPWSPYEITHAVSARRMKLLTSGVSSFVPALREHEEQRVLSLEADRRIRSIFPLGTVRTEVMQEMEVASEILRKVKSWGAELIILGAKTSPSLQITDYVGRALRVARDAPCSVRIARASDGKDDGPVQILIGVDESDSTDRVVQEVAERFWPIGSKASLVAVRKSGARDAGAQSETGLALERQADRLRATGLEVSIGIKDGQPEDVLLREARDISADCIFIESHGLGKGVEAILLGAHCSVEIVRSKNLTGEYLQPAA